MAEIIGLITALSTLIVALGVVLILIKVSVFIDALGDRYLKDFDDKKK